MTKEPPYIPLGVIQGAIAAELNATRKLDEKYKTLRAMIKMGLERGYPMRQTYEAERKAVGGKGPPYTALMASPKSKKKS